MAAAAVLLAERRKPPLRFRPDAADRNMSPFPKESGVTIGEMGNLGRVTHAGWRELANLVRSGKLPDPA
jgi:hypothetical protein